MTKLMSVLISIKSHSLLVDIAKRTGIQKKLLVEAALFDLLQNADKCNKTLKEVQVSVSDYLDSIDSFVGEGRVRGKNEKK